MKPFISKFYDNLKKGDKTLKIIFEDEVYDQDQIQKMIERYSNFFISKGIKNRSRIVIISKNRPYFLFSVFGALSIGAVPVLVEESQSEDDLFYLTKNEEWVITDRKANYPNKNVFYFGQVEKSIKNIKVTKKFMEVKWPEDVDSEKTVIILHSSGTTGYPKKVHYSEKNIDWADIEYFRLYNMKDNNVYAYILPVNCTLGIIACGLIPMLHKKEIVFMDRQDLDWALKNIEKRRVNVLAGIPLMYKYMVRLDLKQYDFSSVNVCDSGGEILPVSIIQKFQKGSGVTITEGYGQTETTSLTHFLIPDNEGKLRIGSVGYPCTDVECKLINEQGMEASVGEIGELFVRGPMVMKGYDDEELNKSSFTRDGWFITGDIVYRDADNYYYMVSRKKDLNNASLASGKYVKEIEEKLYSLRNVVEATTIMNDKSEVRVFIKPSVLDNDEINKLHNNIRSSLRSIPLNIVDIKFVESLPRTATGKVKRRLIN